MVPIMDEWLKDHDNIDEFANELMHKIHQRNQYPNNTPAYAKSDLYCKERFRKFRQNVGQLQETLNQLINLQKLTQRESERRQRLVDNLRDRCRKIENSIFNPVCDKRASLFAAGGSGRFAGGWTPSPQQQQAPTVSWGDGLSNEPEDSSGMPQASVSKLKETQRNMIEDQERGLDALSAIVTRQKSLAQGIDSELNLHNEILEDISEALEDNNQRLLRNTRNIRFVDQKANTCGYWTVILLLLIAILVVSLVP